MSTSSQVTLEQTIRDSGEGWVLDLFAPPDQAMNHIRSTLGAVQREARTRFRGDAPDFSEEALVAEFNRNPRQVRGFFQALGGTRTPEMLLMVWRIIQGMAIKEIQLAYHRQQSFEARVYLESPYGDDELAPYVSKSIQDFALFRHIGILEVGGQPIFDGYYALRIKEQ